MINVEICLLTVQEMFKKTNVNNQGSIKMFTNKILHLKPINNKKQVIKQSTNELKCEGNT